MSLWTLDSGTVTLDSGVFTWDGFAPEKAKRGYEEPRYDTRIMQDDEETVRVVSLLIASGTIH